MRYYLIFILLLLASGSIHAKERPQSKGRNWENIWAAKMAAQDTAFQRFWRYETVWSSSFELPAGLSHAKAREVTRGEGRLRIADGYSARAGIIYEAKCYSMIPWRSDASWQFYAAVGFGMQLKDYLNKAYAETRRGRRTLVRYSFCQQPPRWVVLVMLSTAGGAFADGTFNFKIEEWAQGKVWDTEPCLEAGSFFAAAGCLHAFTTGGGSTKVLIECAITAYDGVSCSE